MGIESDQLVFDYLSKVGDAAQRQLPSAARMRLVSELRSEIDRHRAKAPVDSPAAVRRILARLGTPDEVVAEARRKGGSEGGPGGGTGSGTAYGDDGSRDSAGFGAGGGAGGRAGAGAGAGARNPATPSTPTLPGQRDGSAHDGPDRGPAFPTPRRERSMDAESGRKRPRRWGIPRPRAADRADDTAGGPAVPTSPADAPSPPHLASERELGDQSRQPDWWRVESGPQGFPDQVPGFFGGIEIPEILAPPRRETEDEEDGTDKADADGQGDAGTGKGTRTAGAPVPAQARPGDPAAAEDAGAAGAGTAEDGTTAAPAGKRRFRLPLPRRNAASGTRRQNPLLLLAAASLVVGAVLGHLFFLALGWIIAWASNRLTPTESKWAVAVVPGLSVGAWLLWLWGRTQGQWGDRLTQDQLGTAMADSWPWVVRGAAVASALFVVWRSQRKR